MSLQMLNVIRMPLWFLKIFVLPLYITTKNVKLAVLCLMLINYSFVTLNSVAVFFFNFINIQDYETRFKLDFHVVTHSLQCGFGVSRMELLSSPACRKRQLMEASRGLTAGAIPSVVKV